jgi:integrase
MVLYSTGIRRAELARLRPEDRQGAHVALHSSG